MILFGSPPVGTAKIGVFTFPIQLPGNCRKQFSHFEQDPLFPSSVSHDRIYLVVRSEVSPQLTPSVLVLVTGNLPGGGFGSVHGRDDRKSSLKKERLTTHRTAFEKTPFFKMRLIFLPLTFGRNLPSTRKGTLK
jgi:hypothetical protein